MLEAGDEQPLVSESPGLTAVLVNSSIDYKYYYSADPNVCLDNPSSCILPRGKVMGGTSAVNGMAYVRGSQYDYDNWAKLGNKGWSWNNVLPFFKKFEDLLSVSISKFRNIHTNLALYLLIYIRKCHRKKPAVMELVDT